MSVSGDAARCDMWAGRIGRCLAADMAIGERCSPNKVNKPSLYKRLAVFRDEGPGRFAGKNSETSGWVKATRDGIAADPCQDFGHGSLRNYAAMGRPSSASLACSKNDSMICAGIWWPMVEWGRLRL